MVVVIDGIQVFIIVIQSSARKYFGASFVVQSSTGEYFVQVL